ncbi:hypothetical protein [uncultured Croceitalea sp.]|uniref:hypothetical protein n=1 Tax=uncultured Croceitalea sp. TaxID=1798908 RepID=UPI0033057C57
MKLNRYPYPVIVLFFGVLIWACSSSGGSDDAPPTIPVPSAATLVFPENNTECTTGIVDANDTTKSTITFEWNIAQNADSYTVTVTNLNTDSSTFSNANTNSVDITLDRGVPYSWLVTSRANGTIETTDSGLFRFYNEGPGIENYAPFPAEAIAPKRGSNIPNTSSVTLEWASSDVDNDITGHEVFFDTNNNPTSSIGASTENTLTNISVNPGSTYYWKVVTTDSAGNSSDSEVFEFRVN